MTGDRSFDAWEKELFGAARSEAPDANARRRTLATVLEASAHAAVGDDDKPLSKRGATEQRRAAWPWLASGAAIAVAAGWALMAGSRSELDRSIAPAPERVLDLPPSRSAEPPASSPEPAPRAPDRGVPLRASSAPARSSAEKPAPLTLSDEVALLDRARDALKQRDFGGALAVLDGHARRPDARLRDEALLLRMEALAGAGRSAEASELAARFIAANPGSTLADRARSYLGPRETEHEEP
jgi:hypothetical protein